MKKTLSILLAVLCAFMSLVPAFATEAEVEDENQEPAVLHKVVFYGPSAEYEGGCDVYGGGA